MAAIDRPRRRGDVLHASTTEGGAFLLDPVSGEYFGLDDVGLVIWDHCTGEANLSDICAVVRSMFPDAPDTVAADVHDLIEEFGSAGLLVEPAAGP